VDGFSIPGHIKKKKKKKKKREGGEKERKRRRRKKMGAPKWVARATMFMAYPPRLTSSERLSTPKGTKEKNKPLGMAVGTEGVWTRGDTAWQVVEIWVKKGAKSGGENLRADRYGRRREGVGI